MTVHFVDAADMSKIDWSRRSLAIGPVCTDSAIDGERLALNRDEVLMLMSMLSKRVIAHHPPLAEINDNFARLLAVLTGMEQWMVERGGLTGR